MMDHETSSIRDGTTRRYHMPVLELARLTPLLQDLIRRRTEPSGRGWLEQAWSAAQRAHGRDALSEMFVVAARRVGKELLGLSVDETGRLVALGVTWPMGAWGLDELTRATLLMLAAVHLPAGELEAIVEECYRGGDSRERQAVLRTLPLLPEPGRFASVGVDACRTSIQPVFEAIACENPYPAAHFLELNFNQMVLKAMFIGIALERIVGLTDRLTPELTQMANDYASERRAAGRSVPPDIWRITGEKEREP